MGRREPMIALEGIGVSEGIAIGRAVVLAKSAIELFRIPIEEADIAGEVERFRVACDEAQREIGRNRSGVGRLYGEELAAIFEAHSLLLADRAIAEVEAASDRPVSGVGGTGRRLAMLLESTAVLRARPGSRTSAAPARLETSPRGLRGRGPVP
jgi:hypothetical protein